MTKNDFKNLYDRIKFTDKIKNVFEIKGKKYNWHDAFIQIYLGSGLGKIILKSVDNLNKFKEKIGL